MLLAKDIFISSNFQALYCYANLRLHLQIVFLCGKKPKNLKFRIIIFKWKKSNPNLKRRLHPIRRDFYSIVPDPNTFIIYYNSIRYVLWDGGGDAYIVSVEKYGSPSRKSNEAAWSKLWIQNVKAEWVMGGLALSKKMSSNQRWYICPEATLLFSGQQCKPDCQEMLLPRILICNRPLAFLILPVLGNPDPVMYRNRYWNF